jgi:glycosyltransferase involved in cell wall biosynthesis
LDKKLKIVWLCPYPLVLLKDEINFLRIGKYHPASWIVNLSNYMSSKDEIDLHIVTDSGNISKDTHLVHNNIQFHILKNTMPLLNRSYPWFLPLDIFRKYKYAIKKFVKKISEINPDLVHSYGTEYLFALAGIKSGYPLLITIQGIIHELYKINPNYRYHLLKKNEYSAVKSAKYFSCRTSYDKSFVHRFNPNAKIFKIYEALNPIFLKDNWVVNDTNSLLYLSFVVKRKGIEDLIKAVSILRNKYHDILLNVVGSGEEKYIKHLNSLISDFGIEKNVIFHGTVKTNKIIDYFQTNQIYILPTYNDNYSNALAEAMVSGMPAISTTAGGIKDLISDTENGYLYEPGDTEKLAKLIDYLLQNRDERVRIGKNASNLRIRHTLENVYSDTINSYHNIINSEKG